MPANILNEAARAAAQAAEARKHTANDHKCTELGWSCVPLAVESYGACRTSCLTTGCSHVKQHVQDI